MTQKNPLASFKRRKFTITETLDEVLEKMADQNYQGNVSLCLRAAIEDHRGSLEGTSEELVAHQLSTRLDQLSARQEELLTRAETLEDKIEAESGATYDSGPIHTSSVTEEMRDVHETLASAETGLRIHDLREYLQMPASRIQPALGQLLDKGYVVENGENPHRFHLAGYASLSSRRRKDG